MRPCPPDLVERDRVLLELRDRRSSMSWFEGVALTTALLGGAAFIAGSIGFGIFGAAATAFSLSCIYRERRRLRELQSQLELLADRIHGPSDF